MAPLGYCFGAAGEAIGGGSFASLLLVGTAPAMKALTTGMLTHQGWPVRAAGLARVWAFPSSFFFFLDAIVLATYQVVFAGFVFNQFLSEFKNKHTAAKVL